MDVGFKINCINCNEQMTVNSKYKATEDTSKITVSVINSSNDTIYLVCTNCGNEIEVEI